MVSPCLKAFFSIVDQGSYFLFIASNGLFCAINLLLKAHDVILESILDVAGVVLAERPATGGPVKLPIRVNDLVGTRPGVAVVIDEPALIQYLKEKGIAGAGLDVFAQEPPEKNNPLKELDNVILTPHIGGLTLECGTRVSVLAAQATLDVLQGKKPNGMVNPEVLSQSRWQAVLKG